MSSIRQRLTGMLLASLAVLLVAGGLAVYLSTRAVLLGDFDFMLKSAVPEYLRLATQAMMERGTNAEEILFETKRDPPLYFQVWTTEGATVGRSVWPERAEFKFSLPSGDRLFEAKLPSGRKLRALLCSREVAVERERPAAGFEKVFEVKGGGGRRPAARERRLPSLPGSLVLVVGADHRELDSALQRLGLVLTSAGILMLLLTAAAVTLVSRRGLAPLQAVADEASRIDASRLNIRLPTEGMPTELKTISERLNDLLSRLETAFARERCFSADVAHELRTPITELRSMAEVALKWPTADPQVLELLRDTRDIAVQMQGIVNGLLSIARCEAGTQVVHSAPVLLSELVRTSWEPFEARAVAKQLHLEINPGVEAAVETDAAIAGVILSNLFSNAVEYTPAGGTVQIATHSQRKELELTVTNSVTNIRPEDLSHLFERFWRKDAARSSYEHSGIGLSVAQAFARSLGCTLEARLPGNGMLEIRLRSNWG